jgi:radical SAM protein with 4Fe4S-binding SPASM domain
MKLAKLIDAYEFFKTLSLGKISNYLLLISGFYVSKLKTNPSHWGKVASISIEPTTSCNLRCPQCPSGLRSFTRNTGMLDKNLAFKTIDELKNKLLNLTLYFQGEPFLNPHFLEIVKYASQAKIYTNTSSNAHYFTDEVSKATVQSGLHRLIISIDGIQQKTYEKYRIGGDLNKVINGTQNLVKWKKELQSNTPFIIFQFIVMKHNESEIDQIKKITEELGVDQLQIKTAQIYDETDVQNLLPENKKYTRYETDENGKLKIKNNLLNQCWKMWHSAVITWDGNVVPCCFDKDAQHQLGNVKEKSFMEIWKNESYHRFRKKLNISRKEIEICKNCTEGTKVWS